MADDEPWCGGFGGEPCKQQSKPECVLETGVDDGTGYCFTNENAACVKALHPKCFES